MKILHHHIADALKIVFRKFKKKSFEIEIAQVHSEKSNESKLMCSIMYDVPRRRHHYWIGESKTEKTET